MLCSHLPSLLSEKACIPHYLNNYTLPAIDEKDVSVWFLQCEKRNIKEAEQKHDLKDSLRSFQALQVQTIIFTSFTHRKLNETER